MNRVSENTALTLVPGNLAQGFVFREDVQAKLIHDGKEIFEDVVIQIPNGKHAIALATKTGEYISGPNGEIFAKVLGCFKTPNRTIAHLRKTYTNTPISRGGTSRPKVSMFLDLKTGEEVVINGWKIVDIIEHEGYYEVICLGEGLKKKETHFFYDKNWTSLSSENKRKTQKKNRRDIDAEIYDEEKLWGEDFPNTINTPGDTAVGKIVEKVHQKGRDSGYFYEENGVRVSIFDGKKTLEISSIEQTLHVPGFGKITGFVPKKGDRRRWYFGADKKVVYKDGRAVTSILHMSPHGTLVELESGIEVFLPYNAGTNRVIEGSSDDVTGLLDGKK